MSPMQYRFERVRDETQFEQVFRLAHDVFASELRQYTPDGSGRLIDKFHQKNLYIAALARDELIGMIALHDQPPFSVVDKLSDPAILHQHGRLLEVRLMAVSPRHRNGKVMAGLMLAIVISGILGQARLYHALGFRDLGPPVRSGDAWFIPMMIRVEALAQRASRWQQRLSR
jgi:hypothetical protein